MRLFCSLLAHDDDNGATTSGRGTKATATEVAVIVILPISAASTEDPLRPTETRNA